MSYQYELLKEEARTKLGLPKSQNSWSPLQKKSYDKELNRLIREKGGKDFLRREGQDTDDYDKWAEREAMRGPGVMDDFTAGIGGYDNEFGADGYSPDQSIETQQRNNTRESLRDQNEDYQQDGPPEDDSPTEDGGSPTGDSSSTQESLAEPSIGQPVEPPPRQGATKGLPGKPAVDSPKSLPTTTPKPPITAGGGAAAGGAMEGGSILAAEGGFAAAELMPWIVGIILLFLVAFGLFNALAKKYGADDCKTGGDTSTASGNVIVLDPGHPSEIDVDNNGNPKDEGNKGASGNSLKEYQVTYQLANLIKPKLEEKGYKVILTRSSESDFVSNKARTEIANENNALLMVRIHNDGSSDSSDRGFWFLYPSHEGSINNAGVVKGPSAGVISSSKKATETIYNSIKDTLTGSGMPVHKSGIATEDSAGNADKNGGVLRGSIFSKVPISLIEIGFLSNSNDAAWLKDNSKKEKFAEAMAAGIEKAAPKTEATTTTNNKFYFPVGGTQRAYTGRTKTSGQPRGPTESNMVKKTAAQSFYEWPVPDDKGSASNTSEPGFGACRGNRCERLHKGLDIYANFGAPVFAPENGKITKVGGSAVYDSTEAAGGGNGRYIIMKGESGKVYTFLHLEGFASDILSGAGLSNQIGNSSKTVSVAVTGGQTIAYVGNTGGIQNPHLHFQIGASGSEINPKASLTSWLGGGGSVESGERSEEACKTVDPAPSGSGNAIVEEARKHLGKPYVWGATGPNSFDCSGLALYVYKRATGKTLVRTSRSQYATYKKVANGKEQPGDLVFFGNPVHHVGIVIGNGEFIHAPNRRNVVKISSYKSGYYKTNLRGFNRP